jgi:hypothetical protein
MREPTTRSASRFQGASLTTSSPVYGPKKTFVSPPNDAELQSGGVEEPSVMTGPTPSAPDAPPSTIVVSMVSLASGVPG